MRILVSALIAGALLFHSLGAPAAAFEQVPDTHLAHPELGAPLVGPLSSKAMHELVHLRTEHSRTVLNRDQTRTTHYSSVPLHYQAEDGYWLSRQHELTDRDGKWVFPSHDPSFMFSPRDGYLSVLPAGYDLPLQWGTPRLVRVDDSSNGLELIAEASADARVIDGNALQRAEGLGGIEIRHRLFTGVLLNEYIIHDASVLGGSFAGLVIEKDLDLPAGFWLEQVPQEGGASGRIIVRDDQGTPFLAIHPPVLSGGTKIQPRSRNESRPNEAGVSYDRIGESLYTIRIELSADWISQAERDLPLVARSVVTIENTETVHSCLAPAFHSASISVDVPAGQTVLWTDFEYDFVAINAGWTEDQRSYISGPSGQTAVFSGSGSAEGTQSYSVSKSEIGNGESTGQIEFEFHASRVWGGSGCNASYNFINRRLVSVTYGTIEYGNGPVLINEYSASNRTFADSFNRTEDWIELYNADPDHFFNLEGYHLSNDVADPTKWKITNGVIPPGGHVIVFASQRDISSGMVQHANFNLTQLRPDQIVLADPQGAILEVHEMHVTQLGHSYGRVADGSGDWGLFIAPTPGASNEESFAGYASKPVFDLDSGSYQGPVTVAMQSVGSNEQIRYTTDGSTPTLASSLYTAPIELDQTTVVRARAFSDDPAYQPGFIETRTYLIDEEFTLPIFSFSGDQDLLDLFGGNQALRPLGHFEYFEADGQFIDGNFGDFNKHGNDSWTYPQRGVDFISRDDYGYQRRLEHKFFETSERTRFRRLMVKAAANDNYPFEAGGAHIRDSYIQHLSQVAGLDLDERSSTNVLVFVNGQYWGVYDLRERVDDNNFTSFYYGQDYAYRDSDVYLQFLKTWGGTEAHFGNQPALNDWSALRQYVQNNDMGDPAHFAHVQSQLNIESLIDYFVINSYVVSRDWLNYNTGWWRGLDPAGLAREWRYILWDMEAALGHFHNYTGLPNATHTAPPCQAENLTVGNGHTSIIRKLIQENPRVRWQYVTRYVDLLNTHFSDQNAIGLLDEMVALIAPEMPRQIARWGGNLGTWQNNVEAVRVFLDNRYHYLMDSGLASCYGLTGPFPTQFDVYPAGSGSIRMNSEWLPEYPFDARVFGNIETVLQAEGELGHTFSHWELDGVALPPDLTDSTIEVFLTQATSVTAHFNLPEEDGSLIYYWHFNDLVTPEDVVSIAADFSLIPDAAPLMTYTGSGPRDIDAAASGSDLNLHLGEPSGSSARVRNPSDGRSLVLDLPTSGFEQIKFTYAVERTNNGMLRNVFSYSLDGVNFVQDDLAIAHLDIEAPEVYYLVNLDFASIDGVNDNPDFKIRIDFEGNTTGGSGNNRFDNISLKGVEILGEEAVRLDFASINGGEPVFAGEPFFVVVQAQSSTGLPATVEVDTAVSLSLVSGSGELSGTLGGTIPAGEHSATIPGLLYSQVEDGVALGASADSLAPASSESFSVLQATYSLALDQNVQGAGTVSGGGVYPSGGVVTVSAEIDPGFVFAGWFDPAGDLVSAQSEMTFNMPASDLALMASFALPDNGDLLHYWHFNELESGDLVSVAADYSLTEPGVITYPGVETGVPIGDMDRRSHNSSNPVSNFNLLLDQQPDSGHVLRVRNPSHENMLRIEAPSSGYKDIVVSFATTRTNNGAEQQAFFFSSDAGATWVSVGEPYEISALDEDGYLARTFDLSEFEEVNDNPNLAFKIRFLGDQASNSSGNNRFDNISVHGISALEIVDPIFSDRFE